MTEVENFGTTQSDPNNAAVIQVDNIKKGIKRIMVFIQSNTSKYNQLTDNLKIAISRINIYAGESSWTLSGPFLADQKIHLGPFTAELLSRANEEFWVVPDGVLYLHLRIPTNEKVRIEIFTSPVSVLYEGATPPTAAVGDFTYIVKTECEDVEDQVRVDFSANTTIREFVSTDLSEHGEKEIPLKTDGRNVQYIVALVEKKVSSDWVALSDSDDFGELLIKAGTKSLISQNFATLRALTNLNLKTPVALPAGLIIHKLLPTAFPYGTVFNERFGIDAANIKVYIKGARGNTTDFRFTVSSIGYTQYSKIGSGIISPNAFQPSFQSPLPMRNVRQIRK